MWKSLPWCWSGVTNLHDNDCIPRLHFTEARALGLCTQHGAGYFGDVARVGQTFEEINEHMEHYHELFLPSLMLWPSRRLSDGLYSVMSLCGWPSWWPTDAKGKACLFLLNSWQKTFPWHSSRVILKPAWGWGWNCVGKEVCSRSELSGHGELRLL